MQPSNKYIVKAPLISAGGSQKPTIIESAAPKSDKGTNEHVMMLDESATNKGKSSCF